MTDQKPDTFAVVSWIDPAFHATGWTDLNDAKTFGFEPIISVGIVVHEDKDSIGLSISTSTETFDCILVILKRNITAIKRHRLHVPSKRRRSAAK